MGITSDDLIDPNLSNYEARKEIDRGGNTGGIERQRNQGDRVVTSGTSFDEVSESLEKCRSPLINRKYAPRVLSVNA